MRPFSFRIALASQSILIFCCFLGRLLSFYQNQWNGFERPGAL